MTQTLRTKTYIRRNVKTRTCSASPQMLQSYRIYDHCVKYSETLLILI